MITPIRKLIILFAFTILSVGVAIGAHYMRIPSTKKDTHIENLSINEAFTSGQLTFRAENKQTKAVLSVYETALTPDAALNEITLSMIRQGWDNVLSTPSMAIFEGKKGKCAAAQAYISKDGTTLASIIMQR